MTHLLDIVLLDGFLNNLVTWIMLHGGFFFLLFVVFAETGLFIGFFLPGDSLLFTAGIYLKMRPDLFYNLHYSIVVVLIIIASFLGNMVGYWFGRKTGPVLFHRKESWYFKKKHLARAHDFYEQYGKGTIFLAKFLPIIRTFAPIVAGIVEMNRATFIFYNIVGSIAWVTLMVLGGYFLEAWVKERFHFSLTEYIDVIAIGIILITTLPILYKLFFTKKKAAPANDNNSAAK
ncbi:DedA family protein [Flavisolibacter ginsenosidimutans]|uniref:DedA family protein n=1 Tax=Flavisolibacter ginsenosidimutans TaxID=661481 RepID=A0A5B8UJB8_9BACT|nr:DedA family protein [Flavisolibacter ginsenosidimutans]QEC56239.1 DedA family protein [Flavisolibacter ginsenosidimutans]